MRNENYKLVIAPTANVESIRLEIQTSFESTCKELSLIYHVESWHSLTDVPIQDAEEARWIVVIDAHCRFDETLEFFGAIREKVTNFKGAACLVFTSSQYEVSVPRLDQGSEKEVDPLRLNQFFIRMTESYGWGAFCKLTTFAPLIKRVHALETCGFWQEFKSGQFGLFGITQESINKWRDDLTRGWDFLYPRLIRGPWIDNEGMEGLEEHAERYFRGQNPSNLLDFLAAAHQLGRRKQYNAEETLSEIAKRTKSWIGRSASPARIRSKIGKIEKDSQLAWEEITSTSNSGNDASKKQNLNVDEKRSKLNKNAELRNIFRARSIVLGYLQDLSQNFTKGTALWASDAKADLGRSVRILAIKDYVRASTPRSRLDSLFSSSFKAAFRLGDIEFHCLAPKEEDNKFVNEAWDTHDWWNKNIGVDPNNGAHEPLRVKSILSAEPNEVVQGWPFLEYDIVLIETEYEARFVGPSIIHWIEHAFRELSNNELNQYQTYNNSHGKVKSPPHIFALSRDDSAGHSFLCMALGADAFASKSKITGIPSLMSMVPLGRWAREQDNRKLKPNFFALDGLLPRQRHQLRLRKPDHLIIGDERDRYWISCLPKADLHYHIGTSISLDCISALAANTSGYFLTDFDFEDDKDPRKELVGNCIRIALLTNLVWTNYAKKRSDTADVLWACARFLLRPHGSDGRIVPNRPPVLSKFDDVIKWLTRSDRPVRSFESCAALIVAFDVVRSFIISVNSGRMEGQYASDDTFFAEDRYTKNSGHWVGIGAMARLLSPDEPEGISSVLKFNLDTYFDRIYRNWKDSPNALVMRSSVQRGSPSASLEWLAKKAIERSKVALTRFASQLQENLSKDGTSWLRKSLKAFDAEEGSFVLPRENLQELEARFRTLPIATLSDSKNAIPIDLASLVKIPQADDQCDLPDEKNRSLARYLVGASLLGADHLQFPENILLATFDITKQNVKDNVIYSELRCSTTGYCNAGMNVFDATDFLCFGFDLSAVFFGGWPLDSRKLALKEFANEISRSPSEIDVWEQEWSQQRRWIRTNILVGAKRNKPQDLDAVVRLISNYIERRQVHPPFQRGKFGSEDYQPGLWWDRCRVSGFDLSGDESKQIENLRSSIEPLFRTCTPTTIHAGEAMTAESIWDAVYQLGAQRIGHGLRLRDNDSLLEYCVNRGICMELCPISNAFTNYFKIPKSTIARDSSLIHDRTVYPLLAFLSSGLDACINTDNRSLHHFETLTDDYLMAAKLSGGLSRWEVLRLCKSGFKQAFLPKDQLALLLKHAEYEIFGLVSENSGENGFPPFEFRKQ